MTISEGSNGWCESMSADMHIDDISINCLLTLYLINQSDGSVNDKLTLTKATFLSQKEMADNNLNGYVLEFFRYRNGPFSKDLYEIKDVLIDNNLVNPKDFQLKERGQKILDIFMDVILQNPSIFKCITTGVESIKGLRVPDLLDKVYSIEMMPYHSSQIQKIRDMSEFTVILKSNDYSSIKIDESTLESLEMYCDENVYEDMRSSLEDLRKGNFVRCDVNELFS
jgi:hypothetical protein